MCLLYPSSIFSSQYVTDFKTLHELSKHYLGFQAKQFFKRMYIFEFLYILFLQFIHTLAELKSCSEQHDQLDFCLIGKEAYSMPFPVVVDTVLVLRDIIIEVDEGKHNSIWIQLNLWTEWRDPRIALTN